MRSAGPMTDNTGQCTLCFLFNILKILLYCFCLYSGEYVGRRFAFFSDKRNHMTASDMPKMMKSCDLAFLLFLLHLLMPLNPISDRTKFADPYEKGIHYKTD